jgi:polyisoprenoid-binding protein YceI
MRILFIVAALALSACATSTPDVALPAVDAPAIADTPIKSPSGEYAIDTSHVSVIWKVQHMGLSLFTARFNKVSGTINLDAAAPTKSAVSISIDANSVSTVLPDPERTKKFDAQIATNLGAEKTPNITFVSTSMVRTGAQTGRMTGDLTLNGVTKPVTLDVTLRGEGVNMLTQKAALGFAAKTKIKRSEWGVTFASAFAADEVEIQVDADFGKK